MIIQENLYLFIYLKYLPKEEFSFISQFRAAIQEAKAKNDEFKFKLKYQFLIYFLSLFHHSRLIISLKSPPKTK